MLIPSSHRPIPLVRRADLQICAMPLRGTDHVVIKDPLALVYYQLPLLQYRVLDALDGRRSLSDIVGLIQTAGSASSVSAAEILRLIVDLAAKRLIWSERAGTSSSLVKQRDDAWWRRLGAVLRNPFFIRLPGLQPGRMLWQASCCLGWIYAPAAVAMAIAFVVASWLFLVLHLDTFAHELPMVTSLLSGNGLWTLWIVVGLLKVVHELSHGMACERFGAQCQSIGLAYLFFSPCLYCDVSDAWMIARKSRRIAISLAGIYVELVISTIALWCWRFSGPGLFHQVCLQVFLAGSVATLMFNANPLLRFDGYYVLADWLEIPNLYQRSRQALQRLGARFLLGFRIPDEIETPARTTQFMLVTYGVASLAYQIPLLLGLWFFLYRTLEPVGLTVVVWFCLMVSLTLLIGRFLSWSLHMSRIQKSLFPVVVRSSITVTLLAGALVAIWFCPLRSSLTAPIVIEPRAAQPVYVETPGMVRQVCVHEGDAVEPGTVIVELEDLELDRRLIVLEGLHAANELDFRLAQSIGDPDLMTLAKTAIESSADQIEHARADKDRLRLRATVSGRVMTAQTQRDGTKAASTESLSADAGLLNERLIGTHLNRRTCLCEIAPSHLWQADLWVDQRGRQYLSPGQEVSVRLEAFSGTVVTGKVVAVGAANEAEVPAILSTKYGGPFNTQSGQAGEVPVEPVYCATIALNDVRLPVQTGMRGTGRLARPALTVGSWLTEEFHRVFVVR